MMLYGGLVSILIIEILIQLIFFVLSSRILLKNSIDKKVLLKTMISGVILSLISLILFLTLPNPKVVFIGSIISVSIIGFILASEVNNKTLKIVGYSICWMTVLTFIAFIIMAIVVSVTLP